LRNLQPYLEHVEPWLRQVLLLAQGEHALLNRPQDAQAQAQSEVVSDQQILRLKNYVYNSLRPYPRVLGLMRRSVHAVSSLAR
jgi:hypothetical protein